jgi:hypothetical protein
MFSLHILNCADPNQASLVLRYTGQNPTIVPYTQLLVADQKTLLNVQQSFAQNILPLINELDVVGYFKLGGRVYWERHSSLNTGVVVDLELNKSHPLILPQYTIGVKSDANGNVESFTLDGRLLDTGPRLLHKIPDDQASPNVVYTIGDVYDVLYSGVRDGTPVSTITRVEVVSFETSMDGTQYIKTHSVVSNLTIVYKLSGEQATKRSGSEGVYNWTPVNLQFEPGSSRTLTNSQYPILSANPCTIMYVAGADDLYPIKVLTWTGEMLAFNRNGIGDRNEFTDPQRFLS